MKGRRSEKLRLLDMRDTAERILHEYDKLDDELLADDDLRYFGLVRLMGIIGEAAYQLSRDLRAAHPEVPWRQIMAMRHVIVHEYDDVDSARVWDIIKNYLPALLQQLRPIIASLPE